jgi:hypothetical protein
LGFVEVRLCRATHSGLIFMPTEPRTSTHIDISDRGARDLWTKRFGVTEERLRKAVRMVGSRVTTVTDYLNPEAR